MASQTAGSSGVVVSTGATFVAGSTQSLNSLTINDGGSARIAVREKCGRLDWQVLDWNTPAVDFYRRLGVRMLTEWETFRLAGDALERLARDG